MSWATCVEREKREGRTAGRSSGGGAFGSGKPSGRQSTAYCETVERESVELFVLRERRRGGEGRTALAISYRYNSTSSGAGVSTLSLDVTCRKRASVSTWRMATVQREGTHSLRHDLVEVVDARDRKVAPALGHEHVAQHVELLELSPALGVRNVSSVRHVVGEGRGEERTHLGAA